MNIFIFSCDSVPFMRGLNFITKEPVYLFEPYSSYKAIMNVGKGFVVCGEIASIH